MSRNLNFISHTLFIFIGILLISPCVYAGANTEEIKGATLARESHALLQIKDYAGALEKARRAAEVNPDMPDAWFLQGFALNRLHRPAEALTALQQAHRLGLSGSGLDYEIGWAAIFVGNWDVAAEHLQRYEAAKPGSARISASLGLALLGQGQLDEAEARLREAMQRDPEHKSSALYLLSQIEGARGDIPAARQHLKQIMVETPDSRLGRTLWGGLAREVQRAQAETTASAEAPRKPWRVSASLSGGYNDNVIALGNGLPLPTDISNQESWFTELALGASYDLILSPESAMTYGYSLNSIFYNDVSSFDVIDQYFYLRYTRRLRDNLIATLTGSDQYTIVDSDGFRNELALRPALLYRLNESLSLEFSYRYATGNYDHDVATTIAALDRDGRTHTLSVYGYFNVPNTEVTVQAGFFHVENDTNGANYESDANGFQIYLQSPLAWQISGSASFTKVFSDYDNPDLFSPTGEVRDDDFDRVTLRLTRPLAKGFSAYARYDYTDNDSNVAVFDYDQSIWSAGLIAEF